MSDSSIPHSISTSPPVPLHPLVSYYVSHLSLFLPRFLPSFLDYLYSPHSLPSLRMNSYRAGRIILSSLILSPTPLLSPPQVDFLLYHLHDVTLQQQYAYYLFPVVGEMIRDNGWERESGKLSEMSERGGSEGKCLLHNRKKRVKAYWGEALSEEFVSHRSSRYGALSLPSPPPALSPPPPSLLPPQLPSLSSFPSTPLPHLFPLSSPPSPSYCLIESLLCGLMEMHMESYLTEFIQKYNTTVLMNDNLSDMMERVEKGISGELYERMMEEMKEEGERLRKERNRERKQQEEEEEKKKKVNVDRNGESSASSPSSSSSSLSPSSSPSPSLSLSSSSSSSSSSSTTTTTTLFSSPSASSPSHPPPPPPSTIIFSFEKIIFNEMYPIILSHRQRQQSQSPSSSSSPSSPSSSPPPPTYLLDIPQLMKFVSSLISNWYEVERGYIDPTMDSSTSKFHHNLCSEFLTQCEFFHSVCDLSLMKYFPDKALMVIIQSIPKRLKIVMDSVEKEKEIIREERRKQRQKEREVYKENSDELSDRKEPSLPPDPESEPELMFLTFDYTPLMLESTQLVGKRVLQAKVMGKDKQKRKSFTPIGHEETEKNKMYSMNGEREREKEKDEKDISLHSHANPNVSRDISVHSSASSSSSPLSLPTPFPLPTSSISSMLDKSIEELGIHID